MRHIYQLLLPLFTLIVRKYLRGSKTIGSRYVQTLTIFVYYDAFSALVITSLLDKNIAHLLNYRFLARLSVSF
jgi:hypothetical protein